MSNPKALFIVERRQKEGLLLFSPPTIPGGTVEFISFSERVNEASNIDSEPFTESPCEILPVEPGDNEPKTTVATVNADAPLGDVPFDYNADGKYVIGVEENGVKTTYLSVNPDNSLLAAQQVTANIHTQVDVVFDIRDPHPGFFILFSGSDGRNGPVAEVTPNQESKIVPLLVEAEKYSIQLLTKGEYAQYENNPNYILQTGGTEQGDLVIRPPGG